MTLKPIFERKNVIVTGGAGFLGSYLCDELLKTSKVICIDSFSTGREENINHLLNHPDFEFIRHDCTEPLDLNELPELRAFKVAFQGIQEIYHLACPTSPRAYVKAPLETLLVNSHATRNVLEWSQKHGAKCLLASAAAVYGEPRDATPYPEQYWGFVDPLGIRGPFEEGKRFAEALAQAYRLVRKVDVKIARIFNAYGPRMKPNDGRMIPEFITHALTNEPMHIFGSAEETTTLCFITDLIEGLIRFMRSQETGPINFGSSEPVSLALVAERVKALVGSSSPIEYRKRPPEFVRQAAPTIDAAKERLGWFPVVALDEGLRQTIDYFRGAKALSIESIIS